MSINNESTLSALSLNSQYIARLAEMPHEQVEKFVSWLTRHGFISPPTVRTIPPMPEPIAAYCFADERDARRVLEAIQDRMTRGMVEHGR